MPEAITLTLLLDSYLPLSIQMCPMGRSRTDKYNIVLLGNNKMD
jgi:hypothetical protein